MSPKFTNFCYFWKCCRFFDIYHSVSFKSIENRKFSGNTNLWWMEKFQIFTYDCESPGFSVINMSLFSSVNVEKAIIFRFRWIMVIWRTYRISGLGLFGHLKSGSSTGWRVMGPYWWLKANYHSFTVKYLIEKFKSLHTHAYIMHFIYLYILLICLFYLHYVSGMSDDTEKSRYLPNIPLWLHLPNCHFYGSLSIWMGMIARHT